MDPNETLRWLREMTETLIEGYPGRAAEFAEHFQALDEWLSGGGFLPSDWNMS